ETHSTLSSEPTSKSPSPQPAVGTSVSTSSPDVAPRSHSVPKDSPAPPGPETHSTLSNEASIKSPSHKPTLTNSNPAPRPDGTSRSHPTPKDSPAQPRPETRANEPKQDAGPNQQRPTAIPQYTPRQHVSAAAVMSSITRQYPEAPATVVQAASGTATIVEQTLPQALPMIHDAISTVIRESTPSGSLELNRLAPQLSKTVQRIANLPESIQAPVLEILSEFATQQPAQIRPQLVTALTQTIAGKTSQDTLPLVKIAISTVLNEHKTAAPRILAQQLPMITEVLTSIATLPKPIQEAVIHVLTPIAAKAPEHLKPTVVQPIAQSIRQMTQLEPNRLSMISQTLVDTLHNTSRSELPQTISQIISESTRNPAPTTAASEQQIGATPSKQRPNSNTVTTSHSTPVSADAEPIFRLPSPLAKTIATRIPNESNAKPQVVHSVTQALSQIAKSSPQLIHLATQSFQTIIHQTPLSETHLIPERIDQIVPTLIQTTTVLRRIPQLEPVLTRIVETQFQTDPQSVAANLPKTLDQIVQLSRRIEALPKQLQQMVFNEMSIMAKSAPTLIEPALIQTLSSMTQSSPQLIPVFTQVAVALAKAPQPGGASPATQAQRSLPTQIQSLPQILSPLSVTAPAVRTAATSILATIAQSSPQWIQPETVSILVQSLTPAISKTPDSLPIITNAISTLVKSTSAPPLMARIPQQIAQISNAISNIQSLPQPVQREVVSIMTAMATSQPAQVEPAFARSISQPIIAASKIAPSLPRVIGLVLATATQTATGPQVIQLAQALTRILQTSHVEHAKAEPTTHQTSETPNASTGQTTAAAKQALQILGTLKALPPQLETSLTQNLTQLATAHPDNLTSTLRHFIPNLIALGDSHSSIPHQPSESPPTLRQSPPLSESSGQRPSAHVQRLSQSIVNHSGGPKSFIPVITRILTANAAQPDAAQRPTSQVTQLMQGTMTEVARLPQPVSETIRPILIRLASTRPDTVTPQLIRDIAPSIAQVHQTFPKALPIVQQAIQTMVQSPQPMAPVLNQISDALAQLSQLDTPIQKPIVAILQTVAHTAPSSITPQLIHTLSPAIQTTARTMPEMVPILSTVVQTMLRNAPPETRATIQATAPQIVNISNHANSVSQVSAAPEVVQSSVPSVIAPPIQASPQQIQLPMIQSIQHVITTLTQVAAKTPHFAPILSSALVSFLNQQPQLGTTDASSVIQRMATALSPITNAPPVIQKSAMIVLADLAKTSPTALKPELTQQLIRALSIVAKTSSQSLDSITTLLATTSKRTPAAVPHILNAIGTIATASPQHLPVVAALLDHTPPSQLQQVAQTLTALTKAAPQLLDSVTRLIATTIKTAPASLPTLLSILTTVATKSPNVLPTVVTLLAQSPPAQQQPILQLIASVAKSAPESMPAMVGTLTKIVQLPADTATSILMRLNSVSKHAPDIFRQLTSIISQFSQSHSTLAESTIAALLSKVAHFPESAQSLQIQLNDLSKLLRQNPEVIEHLPVTLLNDTLRQTSSIRPIDPTTLANLSESAAVEWSDEIQKRKKKKMSIQSAKSAGLDALIRHFDATEQEHWKTAAEFRKMLDQRASIAIQ
ncbi:hypothetical protein EBR57_02930, partial [bacterium]|nr:hypothetical protein [bacterium]